jgi:predicted nucleic acid-binding protein
MRFIDTNIFLRYLTGDDQERAEASLAVFERIERGEEEGFTCEAVIAEVVFVLSSPRQYNLSHAEVVARLSPVLALDNLRIEYKPTFHLALELFARHGHLDFEDALIVAHMPRLGIEDLLSYDTDFDRVPGVRRVEP